MRSQSGLSPDLTIPESRVLGDCWVLRPIGIIDSSSAWVFREAIAGLLAPCRVVLDLSAVSFIDSAGLGAIVGAVRRIRERQGELHLAGPRPSIGRVFSSTGLDRIVDIYPDVEDAVAGYRAERADRGEAAY